MDNTSQILERSAELFSGQRLLLVNPAADGLTRSLPADWTLWSWDYASSRGLAGALPEDRLVFSHLCPQVDDLDAAILVMPKAIERAEYALAQMLPLLAQGKAVYLVGEKKGGITRAEKLLGRYGAHPEKLDSARHCQLWRVIVDQPAAPFQLEDWLQQYELSFDGQPLQLVSLPGVFSHGRLDEGSELLLAELRALPEGRVLDFGCGSGVLSIVMARRNPGCRFELVDIDALAIYCAGQSLALNGIEAEVYPSEDHVIVTTSFSQLVY